MIALSSNALAVLRSRYLLKDKAGNFIETPEQMFRRVAICVASAEKKFNNKKDTHKWEAAFFEMMTNLWFLPNSPTLMNAGTKNNQLSACFVLPVGTSKKEVNKTFVDAMKIQKGGGGTGFNFSAILPENDNDLLPGKVTDPIAVIKIMDSITEKVRQGGKRRGANMGILSVSHPDIEKFIGAKKKEGRLANFNISVSVPDAFLKAVQKKESWNLIHPVTGDTIRKIKAEKLWKKIVGFAHETGDPGIIFQDTINRNNPTPSLGSIECTNPCGEVPLLDFEACNLGSINVSKMIKGKKIDWKLLEDIIFKAIRFLDNVIEINDYILPEIEKMSRGNRKIGLGIMGWADLLIQLGIPYSSNKAVLLAKKLMKFIKEKSRKASVGLAEERGVFPNWNKSIYFPKEPIRNATRTSIAPTGTISIIADTSPSIEPIFGISFIRKHVLGNSLLVEQNELFTQWLMENEKLSPEKRKLIRKKGNLSGVGGIPEKIRKLFLTAHEIHYLFHLKHQLAFQKYTDNAVSKTINMPGKSKRKDVENAFWYAWKHGAKGITVFREGSRNEQVLNKGNSIASKKDDFCSSCLIDPSY